MWRVIKETRAGPGDVSRALTSSATKGLADQRDANFYERRVFRCFEAFQCLKTLMSSNQSEASHHMQGWGA